MIGIWHIRYFFFIFYPAIIIWTWLETLRMYIFWCRTDIWSCKFSAKVSLVLVISFPVPSLCKLNHISVCFIQISTKITYKQLIPFRENMFFWSDPSVNFNINEKFLLGRPVFPDYLSVSCDHDPNQGT